MTRTAHAFAALAVAAFVAVVGAGPARAADPTPSPEAVSPTPTPEPEPSPLPPTPDLTIRTEPVETRVGQVVRIPVVIHNYGLGAAPAGTTRIHIRLPSGTRFVDDGGVNLTCRQLSRIERDCRFNSVLWPDDNDPTGQIPSGWPIGQRVKVVEPCSVPGEYRIETARDTNPANNAAPLVVTVPGVECPTVAPSPSGQAGGPLPVTGPAGWTLAAAGAVLAAAGALLLVTARRRRYRVEA